MVKRYGDSVLNSDTAYCFGGNETQDLHITRRSRQYFIHDKSEKKIIPISKSDAKKFSKLNHFELIKKTGKSMRIFIDYKTYNSIISFCDGDEDKVKNFIGKAISEKLGHRI